MSKRIVLDTNVLVSAAISRSSISRLVFDKVIAENELVISEELISELRRVLNGEKFNRYSLEIERTLFISSVITVATFVIPHERVTACRDESDNRVLEAALASNADLIITGDKDLLVLHPFTNILILTPRQFISSVDNILEP
jgi:putative PIN family toxin of toxin-antitoxin system